MRKLFFLLLLLNWLLPVAGQAQTSPLALGRWQVHGPNNRAKALAQVGEVVYVATEEGFFRFDAEDNRLQVLSKSDGFTDNHISTLAYEPETKTLVIAYKSTQIDLLRDGRIINISDLFRKQIPGTKEIYHIFFKDKLAYLATSFGVVVLDLVKREIKDTYSNLGPAGQVLQVYATTILNDSLYLATSQGILAARRSNNNLLDFRNWRTFPAAAGLPGANGANFRGLAAFNNKVFAGVSQDALYRYNGRTWTRTTILFPNQVCWELKADADLLQVVDGERIRLLDKSESVMVQDGPLVQAPRAALQLGNTTFWVADYQQGLVRLQNGQTESFVPNGPMFNSAFRVYADSRQVWVLGGGYDQAYQQRNLRAGFYTYQDGRWESFNAQRFPDASQFPPVEDLVAAIRNPITNKFYLGSYGGGLIEWNGVGQFKVYHPGNSPLLSALPDNPGYTRVPGLAVDAMGNLWVVNRNQLANAPGLHVLKRDGSWQSFRFPGFSDGTNLEKVMVDGNGFKWLSVSRNNNSQRGLLVFDEKQNRFRHLREGAGAGNLPGSDVFALALDHNNSVWVGTDKGVAVFYEPDQVFSGGSFGAVSPVINGRPLLQNQIIRAIAVDGANRKWIGTDTGLWLFSPEGDALVAHFTTSNSPLPSDQILDLAIHHGTGEVFAVTTAGLVSYRSTATTTEGQPDCAVVFPNPVRPGYTGLVGLSGLPNNATVKITDVTGTLVLETKALGGTVAWDLKDLKGKRVRPGVYLAYSTGPDGRQSCVSRIAVVE